MNVTRTNPSIEGLGCANCGGEGDCFDSPAYGYAAANSARDQPGIEFGQYNMPSRTQVMAVSLRGGVQPLAGPGSVAGAPTANAPYGVDGGYPAGYGGGTNAARVLAQTSPDYPTPTALTVAQAFQSAIPDAGAQPGHVQLPMLNYTANNLSFVKPVQVSAACQVESTIESHPLLIMAGVFGLFYFMSGRKGKQ